MTIAPSAFFYCVGLTEVVLPETLTHIGKTAFAYCFHLQSVTLPGCLTTVDAFAFEDCSELLSVTIPPSVGAIGTGAFGYTYDEAKNQDLAVSDFVISGVSGSTAEAYATKNGFAFTALEGIAGDLNGDSRVTVADLVLFRHWLLRENVQSANWQAADMDKNGVLNALDFCLMKRAVLDAVQA